ncbi:muramoyltetrapeptide carboxypeptidase [Salmonella enterica subsp. enterica serovar Choleraesuis]|nr:muramoyltetrapeptide carboxypeptidase [Salmonella enterica subsp. enterica serovar Choleraesuis]
MSDIHLVAPSGYCLNQEAALRGIERLLEAGHQVSNAAVIGRREQRFAGSDSERLADLNRLADLSESQIVLAVRGGYGLTRLLDSIDFEQLAQRQRRSPLLICGHSDFTAFQAGLLNHGIISFSGPMLAGNFGAPELNQFTWRNFWRALREPNFTLSWECAAAPFHTQGKVWGGNLAMLTSLLGTPWFPKIDNGILVLEDINELPFRVERMLLQLHYAGVLKRQRAIVFGDFTGGKPNDYDAGYDMTSVVNLLRSKLNIPLITGFAWGHEQRTVTLPLGAHGELHHNGSHVSFTLSGHPTLSAD